MTISGWHAAYVGWTVAWHHKYFDLAKAFITIQKIFTLDLHPAFDCTLAGAPA